MAGNGEMIQTRRAWLREQTSEAIKRVAREQMAVQGTANLSLRQIAAQLGMTAPALYRYYTSRDDLLTALIVDAFTALADAMEAALAAYQADGPAQRIEAGMLAFRDWAVSHPTEFALIYGSPIPGYTAPVHETNAPAARPGMIFLSLLHEAQQRGELILPSSPETISPLLTTQLAAWRDVEGNDLPLTFLYALLSVWAAIYGMVALEVFGHLGDIIADPGEFYRVETRAILTRFGLHIPADAGPSAEGGAARGHD